MFRSRARAATLCPFLIIFLVPGLVSADGIDDDGDGYCEDASCADGSLPGDCDDGDPTINPGAIDNPGNDFDENCSGFVACFVDFDNDTFGSGSGEESTHTAVGGAAVVPGACASSSSDGYDDTDDDCNDFDPEINPDAEEIPDDGIDQDCNGVDATTCYEDLDQDGYGGSDTVIALDGSCDTADSESGNNADCNDTDPAINPGADEIPGDGIDQDCNGVDATTCYEDLDQDGYGGSDTVIALDGSCDAADSESDNNADCDDTDPAINPGAEDTCGDGVDSDCDGQGGPTDDEDGDGCNWQQEDAAGTSDCDVDSDSDQLNEMDEMGANCVYDAGETDPTDPDTDGDGAWDGDEVLLMGTDPLDDDSDADGLSDSVEDGDHDGVPDLGETDPMDADTDDDGLMDGEEDLNGNGVVDAGELNRSTPTPTSIFSTMDSNWGGFPGSPVGSRPDGLCPMPEPRGGGPATPTLRRRPTHWRRTPMEMDSKTVKRTPT
jgi:hypothetical protein